MIFVFSIASTYYTPIWLEVRVWELFLEIVSRIDALTNKGPYEELAFFL